MPGPLHNAAVTDAERRAHDRHRLPVVLAVLAVLALHVYLLTPAASFLGIPSAKDLIALAGVSSDKILTETGLFAPAVTLLAPESSSKAQYLSTLYLAAIGAFLSVYFLRLDYKLPALLAWSVAAVLALYGVAATAGLLLAHVVVYLTLHPRRKGLPLLGLLPGVLGTLAFSRTAPASLAGIGGMALAAAASVLAYRYMVVPLLANPRIAGPLRTLVVQSALIAVCIAALIEGRTGAEWTIPLGLLLFFWQWARLMLYHVDYKDGLVPEDTSFPRYLVVFLSPGAIPAWTWSVEIGQGYSYTINNFLCENKNKTVLAGVRILLVALLYLGLWSWGSDLLARMFGAAGVDVFGGRLETMIDAFVSDGAAVGTASVLATTLVHLATWTMAWAGIAHLKVGLWRICGFRCEPYFDRPWMATNLVALWTRFTFHYREFLVRAFYFPVFFGFFRKRPYLRIVAATMAAAAAGNMIWGHLTEEMFYQGTLFSNFFAVFRTWPYYVLLGCGISITELYLLKTRHRRRKPWTPGPRIVLDVLAAYATIQFYAMIHIFWSATEDSTVWDLFRLFVRGFGVHL